MLSDIRETLDTNHQKAYAAADRLPPTKDTRRSSPPSELSSSGSPSTTPRMQQNRSTPTKQLASNRTKRHLAKIRRDLKPFANHSDPGFASQKDKVNKALLEELLILGHSENSAVAALLACNSASVDAALDVLQQEAKRKLSCIQEDEGVRTLSEDFETHLSLSQRSSDKTPTPDDFASTSRNPSVTKESRLSSGSTSPSSVKMDSSSQYDPADISTRISPITLPGFQTPINFVDLPPPPRTPPATSTSRTKRKPPSYTYNTLIMHTDVTSDTYSDSSPTRTSPPYITSNSPPYTTISEPKTHVHVSPPPEVQPHSYSPFSAPFSDYYRRQSPPSYERSYKLSKRLTPTTAELSDSGIEEETTPQRPSVPPEAFKFFMEQHIENIYKSYQQRQQRRMKLEMEMAKRGLDEATSEQMRKILYQKESNFLRLKRAKMHKNMFDTVKPLGIGAFGVVSLVRKRDTGKLYAMKTLRKVDVLRRNQVAHVKAERDILAEADNEWVVKLFFSFQDVENLYFVMEYIPGGDMMSLLIKLGTFPEHLTLFYIAELVNAIESVHKMGFIHRDIKPDNILIGADGHIKLTDFGLCTGFRWTHDSRHYQPKGQHHRQGSMEPQAGESHCSCQETASLKPLELRKIREQHRCLAHSLVGTPNYIAPEILRRIGYFQLCDWWSVGVIMYEMLVGQPPFMAPTPSETQVKIMNWHEYLHIPRHAVMSPAAADLILRFCCDPQNRIGRNGADEIKRHPFFSAIDWEVGIRNYEPPYIPKILYDADTSNFDPIPQCQLQKLQSKRPHEASSLPKGQPEHAFYEWTFIRFYPERTGAGKKPTITPSSVYSQEPRGAASSPVSKEKRKAAPTPVYV